MSVSGGAISTALLTANVFQNALANRGAAWGYYPLQLRKLSLLPIYWYMTALDYALAVAFWEICKSVGSPECQVSYLMMLQKVKVCPIDEQILDEAEIYPINFCDALRLACARERNLDAIVTWEPHHFAHRVEEHNQVQLNGYLKQRIRTEESETRTHLDWAINIYSVRAFLLNWELSKIEKRRSQYAQKLQVFQMLEFHCTSNSEGHNDASLTLCSPAGQIVKGFAIGNSPIDALQRAIDCAIEQYILLPKRYLTHFYLPPSTLFGADALVEVVIGVECDRNSFEESASSGNMFQAAAEAYIRVINKILCNPIS
jgi:LeuA allosteric (dimerisation) domain